MRICLVFALLLTMSLPTWANPDVTKLVDWTLSPAGVKADFAKAGIDAKQKMFHKSGMLYLKAEIATLGNHWDGTVYFNEQDVPNQFLLQLENKTRSGTTRVQKLAVGEFGENYKVRTTKGKQRDDHFFTWQLEGLKIVLNTASYRSRETKTIWLKITPLE